jgi:hypothetical protein
MEQGCSQGANSFIVDRRIYQADTSSLFWLLKPSLDQLVDRLGCS